MPRGAPIGTGNDNPPFRFYGRRKGRKLRPRRQHLVDEVLPQLRIDLQDAATPDRLFDFAPAEIWLEIGFGGGEHLAWQARANPEIGLIGAEPYINGIATLLARLEDDPAANIRIWPEDARPLLTALPQASLARVFILHPDPWPKTRHAARRIVGPETLELLAAAMADGASLRI
ncbi:MAG: tRNA (guanine(46)-N(7))-methyltransferase TrmB, partial [Alphaproteobacteria bacterium]|nr:tRNA (guanine(46)-N(7))-methyltransferase TrmB [Alphaproteobacteria bacterium]